MRIIAVVNAKGGVGKTTLTSCLAVEASKESERVALVDLDPQRSLVSWWQRRGESKNPTIFASGASAAEAVEQLEQTRWDWVFFDCAPGFLTEMKEAIDVAHLALVPLKPSLADLESTADALELARQAETPVLCVLNEVPPRSSELADQIRQALVAQTVPVAEASISDRVSYPRALTAGKVVAEVDSGRHKDAAKEVTTLWSEVKEAANA